MFLVGLSGGIACGKSTVSSTFADLYGVPVVDADKIARDGWFEIVFYSLLC